MGSVNLHDASLVVRGSHWQHRKHDEEAGRFHQYKVIGVTLPGEPKSKASYKIVQVTHTELMSRRDGGRIWLHEREVRRDGGRIWLHEREVRRDGETKHLRFHAFDPLEDAWINEQLVFYQNLIPEYDPTLWVRPLEMFLHPGRFTPLPNEEPAVAKISGKLIIL